MKLSWLSLKSLSILKSSTLDKCKKVLSILFFGAARAKLLYWFICPFVEQTSVRDFLVQGFKNHSTLEFGHLSSSYYLIFSSIHFIHYSIHRASFFLSTHTFIHSSIHSSDHSLRHLSFFIYPTLQQSVHPSIN